MTYFIRFILILCLLNYCEGSGKKVIKEEVSTPDISPKTILELSNFNNEILISIASKLRCRKSPETNSAIIREFGYASLLDSIGKNNKKITIEGKNDYWYYLERDDCWVFGGFTIKTGSKENPTLFNTDVLVAPVRQACGGHSCFPAVGEVTIIGKYFITSVAFQDYCDIMPGNICSGELIGYAKVTKDKIELNNTIEIGTFDEKGNWLGKIQGYRDNYTFRGSTSFVAVKNNGVYTEYFADPNYSTLPKEEVQKECEKMEDICARYYIPTPYKVFEDEKSRGNGKWSRYQGRLNWNAATEKCQNLKMKLPTTEQIKRALEGNEIDSWFRDGKQYWTLNEEQNNEAKRFNLTFKKSYSESKKDESGVRCIKK